MGGAQSGPTRKISVPNEDSQFIEISKSVADRLKKCNKPSPEEKFKAAGTEDCIFNEMPPEVRNIENIDINNRPLPGDPLLNFYYGPSITSIRVLQEKEKELRESEDYWSNRIREMEDHHAKLSKIMEDEYNKALEEISNQSPRPPPGTDFPCQQEREKIISCYSKNPNEVLLCAGEVTMFTDCVHSKRINDTKRNKPNADDDEQNGDKNNINFIENTEGFNE